MSISENIYLWKKKSEIDYIPLFISLWLSFNAWVRDRYVSEYVGNKDRHLIEQCKRGGNPISDKFSEMMRGDDAESARFKGNLAELQRALKHANLPYGGKWKDKYISFESSLVGWENKKPKFLPLIKQKSQKNRIQIDEELYVDDNLEILFAAYIEIAYRIRCLLFHGALIPNEANERVVEHLYKTLSMIMRHV